jgi:type II secretory pathway pseudopilin PulG
MTLLEMSVVIAVLLALTTVLMIGAHAWKNSSDRAGCILHIRSIQLAVRSYQNMYGYNAGGMPYAENGTQDIAVHLHNKGYISAAQYSAVLGSEPCAGGGTYERDRPDVFPPVGTLYIGCSLSQTKAHELSAGVEW